MAWPEQQARVVAAKFRQYGGPVAYLAEGSAGPPLEIVGCFRQRPFLVDIGSSAIQSVDPSVDLRAVDVPPNGPQARATVTVAGVDYRISDVEGPDDGGVVRCVLKEVIP